MASLKSSKPFSEVLSYVKSTLMGETYAAKIDSTLEELESKSQSEVIDFFSVESYGGDVQKYWFHYYLLAKLNFFSETQWERPEGEDIEDENYSHFKEHDHKFHKKIGKCKEYFSDYLKHQKGLNRIRKSKHPQLKDFEYSFNLLDAVRESEFYKLVDQKLPKGVIFHSHWSASFTYDAIFNAVNETLAEEVQDGERTVVLSTKVYMEDMSVGGQTTEKHYRKFLLTKYKYLDPQLLAQNLENNKAKLEAFKQSMIDGDKCLNYVKNKAIGFDPSIVDPFLLGFLYSQACADAVIYNDGLAEAQYEKAVLLSEAKSHLKEWARAFESDATAINELPNSYKLDNPESEANLAILGIWFRFEMVFQSYGAFMDDKRIFNKLTKVLFENYKSQNVQGIEFRNKFDPWQISTFQNHSTANEVPFSFITPGRKVAGKGSKGGAIVAAAPKITDPRFAGIDFFAFEDDAYNGARNFFALAMTKLIAGETSTYFNQMFNYLDQNGGKMYLHAGETRYFPKNPITEDYANTNYINDNLLHGALLPGVKRLGHAFESTNSNLILSILKKRDIALEICPISNQVLNFHDVIENPGLDLLRRGLSVSISPDDPGIFGYLGVSMDWFFLINETNVKLSEIYLLLKHSIDHSTIPEVVKDREGYLKTIVDGLDQFYEDVKHKRCKQEDDD